VRTEAAIALGAPREAVQAEQPLQELGLDSLAAVRLRNQLARAAGLRLPITLLFDHPTPAALARRIADELRTEAAPSALAMPPRSEANRERVAAGLSAGIDAASDDQLFALIDESLAAAEPRG
jgi:acyl carrier protein